MMMNLEQRKQTHLKLARIKKVKFAADIQGTIVKHCYINTVNSNTNVY